MQLTTLQRIIEVRACVTCGAEFGINRYQMSKKYCDECARRAPDNWRRTPAPPKWTNYLTGARTVRCVRETPYHRAGYEYAVDVVRADVRAGLVSPAAFEWEGA